MTTPAQTPDGYIIVPPISEQIPKGIQCGECRNKFDYGVAIGFYCGNPRCPMQYRVIC